MFYNKQILSEPYKIIKEYNIYSYDFSINNLRLNQSFNLQINFFDASNNILKYYSKDISGEIYKNWGYDDNYIITFIESNLENFFLDKELIVPEVTSNS